MKKIALTAAIAGLLLFSGTAMADEQQKNDGHTDGHDTTQVQPASSAQTSADSSDALSHNMTVEEHQNMNTETGESGEHGHGNVVETPPNVPVLSAFAAINAGFLLIGVWNKRFRKKGGALA